VSSKAPLPFLNWNLFLHSAVWTLLISHFVQNCQVYFAEWLPLFYNSYLGVSPDVASICLTVAASIELPSRAATKNMPDHLARKGMSLLQSRKFMSLQGFGFHCILCAVFGLMILQGVTSPIAFTTVFTLSRAVQAFHSGGYFANYLDLTQDYVGMLSGVGNTLASFAGVVVPNVVAYNLRISKDNWVPIAAGGVGLNLVACSLIYRFMSTSCLDGALASESDSPQLIPKVHVQDYHSCAQKTSQ